MKIQQWFFKILRKQNITDVRTHAHMDNVKTVYPPQTKFVGGMGGGGVTSISSNIREKWQLDREK